MDSWSSIRLRLVSIESARLPATIRYHLSIRINDLNTSRASPWNSLASTPTHYPRNWGLGVWENKCCISLHERESWNPLTHSGTKYTRLLITPLLQFIKFTPSNPPNHFKSTTSEHVPQVFFLLRRRLINPKQELLTWPWKKRCRVRVLLQVHFWWIL